MLTIDELEGKSWQEVKAIAQNLNYTKPEDLTWTDQEVHRSLIELSKKADMAQTKEAESKEKVNPELTKYFVGNGIPFCKKCGGAIEHRLNGAAICPKQLTDCPQLK